MVLESRITLYFTLLYFVHPEVLGGLFFFLHLSFFDPGPFALSIFGFELLYLLPLWPRSQVSPSDIWNQCWVHTSCSDIWTHEASAGPL